MRLRITHRTEYRYDAPVPYALQRLRLVPYGGPSQSIKSWSLAIEGAREELRFTDHFGNDTRLLSVEGAAARHQRRGSRRGRNARYGRSDGHTSRVSRHFGFFKVKPG